MASKRTPLLVILPFVAITAACSLVTSLDGLTGGSDSGTATDAASDTKVEVTDAGVDVAQPSVLDCDASGLVAYFALNEGSGTVVHDCHQGIEGVFGGDASPTWGTRDTGIDLEFTHNAYVTFGIVSTLELPGPFTVAGWFRADSDPSDDTSVFWDFSGSKKQGFEITLNAANNLYAQVGNGTGSVVAAFTAPTLGVWVHLALVYEPGARLEAFTNGVSTSKVTTDIDGGVLRPAAACTSHDARLGANYSPTTWTGGIPSSRRARSAC